MANINLLPWREERRQELRKEFLTVLGAVALAGIIAVLLANRVYSSWIDNQNGRNEYLQNNINELNRQVAEIKEMENKRRELLDRMKVIQDLQGTRPLIVRVFDEIVRTLPDGVFYQSLARTDKTMELTGVAESNNRVSSLMRQFDRSEWFENPNLTSVQAAVDFGEQASGFKMTVVVSTPGSEASAEAQSNKNAPAAAK
ncbi:MAG: PilN domain-containing protein [Spongiibacteraceae bacterium]